MSSSNMIVLKSSDGEAFEVEEAVAFVSRRIKYMIEDECCSDWSLPGVVMLRIGDVTSKILSMVLEYCKKHVDTPADDLKSFDSDLVKVDQGTLFDLILAATSLDIKSLLDVAYQAVGNMIKGKTTEEIRMTFNIKNDFTPEEEQEVFMETNDYVLDCRFDQKQDSLDDLETSKRMRMSEYIVSFSHQKEIMIRLPVATVLECRRVSKAWKSLIDSPAFITAHSHYRYTHPRLLLVSSALMSDGDDDLDQSKSDDDLDQSKSDDDLDQSKSDDDLDQSKSDDDLHDLHYQFLYSSFVDDDTFLQEQLLSTDVMPFEELFGMVVVGSWNGLTCLGGYAPKLGKLVAVIWNPIIGKKVIVPYAKSTGDSGVGFGVCPVTGDIKLVTVNFDDDFAKVLTLSTRKWRGIPMLPHAKSWDPKTTEKFLHSCCGCVKKVVSFDLTDETWKATDVPDTVTSFEYTCKIRDSFAMVVPTPGKGLECSVWTLENDQTSFTKLFNLRCESTLDVILASRANGRLIMLRACPGFVGIIPPVGSEPPRIVEYDPKSGVDYPLSVGSWYATNVGPWYDTNVTPYEQTLLLLDCHATLIEDDLG